MMVIQKKNQNVIQFPLIQESECFSFHYKLLHVLEFFVTVKFFIRIKLKRNRK